jgi:hypothetical protein
MGFVAGLRGLLGRNKRDCRDRERRVWDEAQRLGLDGVLLGVFAGRSVQLLEVAVTERRVRGKQQRRLEREGFTLEVSPVGKRLWREPGTGRRLSGDHAFELVRQKEARTLEEEGWERAEVVGRETYWRRPDSGHLYPQGAAYDVVMLRAQEEPQA